MSDEYDFFGAVGGEVFSIEHMNHNPQCSYCKQLIHDKVAGRIKGFVGGKDICLHCMERQLRGMLEETGRLRQKLIAVVEGQADDRTRALNDLLYMARMYYKRYEDTPSHEVREDLAGLASEGE